MPERRELSDMNTAIFNKEGNSRELSLTGLDSAKQHKLNPLTKTKLNNYF